MNIIEYISKNGNISFKKKPLNEVDKLIFSQLSYVKYDGAVPTDSREKKRLQDVANDYFKDKTKKDIRHNILAIRTANKILNLLKDTKRYKDLLMYNDVCIIDDNEQFSAVCIEIEPHLVYVSFEGTDENISGWFEDCQMSYAFPIRCHRHAIKYLDKHFTFSNDKLIVGGHSKGGNLALVASMCCNPVVRKRILNVYSYDGPGLRKKQIESHKYQRIKNRLVHVVPNYSIVGLLMRHDSDYIVVKSSKSGPTCHNAATWQMEGDEFKRVKLSLSSRIFEQGLRAWLDRYNDDDREKFTAEIFFIFKYLHITSLIDLYDDPKLLLKIYREASKLDPLVASMTKDLIEVLKDYSKQAVKSIFSK